MRPRSFSDDELLATARRIFLEQGPAVSTTRIADALGVSQAALFKRFATKKELMIKALMPTVLPAWIERVADGPDERPVPEQLHEIITEIDVFFSRMMPCLSVVRAAGVLPSAMLQAFPGEPPPVRAQRALADFFAALDAQGRANIPDPKAYASAFLGAIHGHHNLNHMLGKLAPDSGENYSARLVDLFWAAIDPRPRVGEQEAISSGERG